MTDCKHFRRKGVTTAEGPPIFVCANCGQVRGHYTKAEIVKRIRESENDIWQHNYRDEIIQWIEVNL